MQENTSGQPCPAHISQNEGPGRRVVGRMEGDGHPPSSARPDLPRSACPTHACPCSTHHHPVTGLHPAHTISRPTPAHGPAQHPPHQLSSHHTHPLLRLPPPTSRPHHTHAPGVASDGHIAGEEAGHDNQHLPAHPTDPTPPCSPGSGPPPPPPPPPHTPPTPRPPPPTPRPRTCLGVAPDGRVPGEEAGHDDEHLPGPPCAGGDAVREHAAADPQVGGVRLWGRQKSAHCPTYTHLIPFSPTNPTTFPAPPTRRSGTFACRGKDELVILSPTHLSHGYHCVLSQPHPPNHPPTHLLNPTHPSTRRAGAFACRGKQKRKSTHTHSRIHPPSDLSCLTPPHPPPTFPPSQHPPTPTHPRICRSRAVSASVQLQVVLIHPALFSSLTSCFQRSEAESFQIPPFATNPRPLLTFLTRRSQPESLLKVPHHKCTVAFSDRTLHSHPWSSSSTPDPSSPVNWTADAAAAPSGSTPAPPHYDITPHPTQPHPPTPPQPHSHPS